MLIINQMLMFICQRTHSVLGKEMTFLIVLGATHSFIKSDMFDTHPKNERMSC